MRWSSLIGAGMAAVPAAWLTWLFFVRYWLHRDCIAEALSSCFVLYPDGSQDNLADGGFVWGLLALPFWALAAWFVLTARPRPSR